MVGEISYVSHAAVEALSGSMIVELLEFASEAAALHQGISAVSPLSSTPMGGRNVGMLISQQQSFMDNMAMQAQQQVGHLDGMISKSVSNTLVTQAGANSIGMGGISELGSVGSSAGNSGSMAMPMAGGMTSGAMSAIGGAGNAGSSALNQIGSGVMQAGSGVGQAVSQGVSQGVQQGGHQNGGHDNAHKNSSEHKDQNAHDSHHGPKKIFSLKSVDSSHSVSAEPKPQFKVAVASNPSHSA